MLRTLMCLAVLTHIARADGMCWEDNAKKQADSNSRAIVHSASVVNGAIAAWTANVPGAGRVPITLVEAGMIAAIGAQYGCHIDLGLAVGFIMYRMANKIGGFFAQTMAELVLFLGSWAVPGVTHAIKAMFAGGMTESMGHSAISILRCGGSLPKYDSKFIQDMANKHKATFACIVSAFLSDGKQDVHDCVWTAFGLGAVGSDEKPQKCKYYRGGQFLPSCCGGGRAPAGGKECCC